MYKFYKKLFCVTVFLLQIIVLSGCSDKANVPSKNISHESSLSLTEEYAYISYGSGVSVCQVQLDGMLAGCHITSTTPEAYSVTLSRDGNYAYLVQRDSSKVLLCPRDKASGEIASDCGITLDKLNKPTQVVINSSNTNAYIINNATLMVCKIIDNKFKNCANIARLPDKISGLVLGLDNVYAYILTSLNNETTIWTCSKVSETGNIKNCTNSLHLKYPLNVGLDVDFKSLYIAMPNYMSDCLLNLDGNINSCKIYEHQFSNIAAITVYSKNKVYIADAVTDMLYNCKLLEDHSSACNKIGRFPGITNITVSKI